jgi:flagellum-specific ATP synthase
VTEPSSAEAADSTLGELALLSGSFEAPVVSGQVVDGGMPLHNAIPPLHIPS